MSRRMHERPQRALNNASTGNGFGPTSRQKGIRSTDYRLPAWERPHRSNSRDSNVDPRRPHRSSSLRVRNTGSVVDQFTFERSVRCRLDHRRPGGVLALPGRRGDRRRLDRRAPGTDDAPGSDAVRGSRAVEGGPDRLGGRRRRARRRGVRRPASRTPPDAVIEQPPGPSPARRRQPRQRPDPPGVRRPRPRGSAAFPDRCPRCSPSSRAQPVHDGQGAPRRSASGAASRSACRSRSWPPKTATIRSPPTARWLQQPLLPRWFWKAVLAALVLLLILLFILWKTLLEPSIESTARDSAEEVVADEVAAIDERLDAAGSPKRPAQAKSRAVRNRAASRRRPPERRARSTTTTAAIDSGPTTTSIVTATTVGGGSADLSPLGQPIDFRLALVVDPLDGDHSFTVPDGQVLSVTDIVLQNPIRRHGRPADQAIGHDVVRDPARQLPRPRLPLRLAVPVRGGRDSRSRSDLHRARARARAMRRERLVRRVPTGGRALAAPGRQPGGRLQSSTPARRGW